MIWLTRLNHVPFVLNAELITHMEVTPDTVIFLTDGQKIVVRESAELVVAEVLEYRRAIAHVLPKVVQQTKDRV
ncbi:MAG TPA: flagellar FlbD family protein [Bryobacteraceae bacterium]|nr:flagellar FlbD family protein [Bryobacteraceae bacterium]